MDDDLSQLEISDHGDTSHSQVSRGAMQILELVSFVFSPPTI